MENMEKLAYTQNFLDMLDTPEGTKEVNAAGGNYIKTILREEGIARKIIPFKKPDLSKLQRRTNSDELYDLIDIEPGSGAVVSNFTASAPSVYIYGKRAELTFSEIKAVTVEKTVEELLAIPYDIFGVIKHYTTLDMQHIEDNTFLGALITAATEVEKREGIQKIIRDTTASAKFAKEHFYALKNVLDTNRLKATRLVCAAADLNDLMLMSASEYGFNLAEKFMTGDQAAADFKKVYQMEVISSIKTEMFREHYTLTGEPTPIEVVTILATDTKVTVGFNVDKVTAVYNSVSMLPENRIALDATTPISGKDINFAAAAGVTQVFVVYEKKRSAPEIRTKRRMFVLPDNNYLGAARELVPVTFWSEKKENRVRMGAFESIGMVIANARAVGVLEIG